MYNDFTREATSEEVAIYNKIEAILDTLTEEEQNTFIETVGDRVFDYTHSKAIYNKCYRLAKKYNVTVDELETWYCID